MTIDRTRTLLAAAALTLLAAAPIACSGSGQQTQDPDAATAADPVAAMTGLQTEATAEIDAVMRPIHEAEALADQVGGLPAKLGISAAELGGMLKASFDGSGATISADLDLAADAKAELEALLAHVARLKADLAATPDTVAKATGNLTAILGKATAMMAKFQTTLGVKAKFSSEAAAQLDAVTAIKGHLDAMINQAKADFQAVPQLAAAASAKLVGSFALGT